MPRLRGLKTKKGVAKRFKITKKGKVKHPHSGKSHLLTNKTKKRKRRLKKAVILSHKLFKNIKRLLLK
ncbi:MAG: 50S ribosomal protein L35 [Candidatus Omnitrophota bacterium]